MKCVRLLHLFPPRTLTLASTSVRKNPILVISSARNAINWGGVEGVMCACACVRAYVCACACAVGTGDRARAFPSSFFARSLFTFFPLFPFRDYGSCFWALDSAVAMTVRGVACGSWLRVQGSGRHEAQYQWFLYSGYWRWD